MGCAGRENLDLHQNSLRHFLMRIKETPHSPA